MPLGINPPADRLTTWSGLSSNASKNEGFGQTQKCRDLPARSRPCMPHRPINLDDLIKEVNMLNHLCGLPNIFFSKVVCRSGFVFFPHWWDRSISVLPTIFEATFGVLAA